MNWRDSVDNLKIINGKFDIELGLDDYIDKKEKKFILEALEETNKNITAASEILKISRQSLH